MPAKKRMVNKKIPVGIFFNGFIILVNTNSGDFMITNYKIISKNNKEILYLYFDFNYEFGNLSGIKKKTTILHQISQYIKDKKILFNGTKIILIANGIIIGSLLFAPKQNKVEYVLSSNIPVITSITEKNNTPNNILPSAPVNEEKVNTQTPSASTSKSNTNVSSGSNNNTSSNNQVQNNTATPNTTNNNSTTPSPSVPSNPTPPTPTINNPVTVYRSNGSVVTLELEDYLVGVVAAEMPASFETEALKAQAVAARTYTLKAKSQNKRLTDTVSTQVYEDNNQLKSKWGGSYNTYYNKIKNAVNATDGQYITYQGKYIDAVYHSTNNGYTEDPIIVWGYSIPYLKTVESPWDLSASSYLKTITKDIVSVGNTLGLAINDSTIIEILERDTSNHIVSIKVGDKTFLGVDIRNLLGLRSTDFDMSVSGDMVTFTTRGYGHAVGLSQYGANGMAKSGYGYIDILKHYYTGVNIS